MIECKDTGLKGLVHKDTGNEDLIIVKCCQITVRNANKSMLQGYIIPTNTKYH